MDYDLLVILLMLAEEAGITKEQYDQMRKRLESKYLGYTVQDVLRDFLDDK